MTKPSAVSPADQSSTPRRRVRPQDPAVWLWAAVALMALVPLQHAVASHSVRRGQQAAQAVPAPGASTAQPERAAGSATP
jgi:hypothetical protein